MRAGWDCRQLTSGSPAQDAGAGTAGPRSAHSRSEEVRRPVGLVDATERESAAHRAAHRTRHAVPRDDAVEDAFAGHLEMDVVAADAHAFERHGVVPSAELAVPGAPPCGQLDGHRLPEPVPPEKTPPAARPPSLP